MFDNLSQSLEKAWDVVRKDGKLTPENVKGPIREIRRSLLEADVCPMAYLHTWPSPTTPASTITSCWTS